MSNTTTEEKKDSYLIESEKYKQLAEYLKVNDCSVRNLYPSIIEPITELIMRIDEHEWIYTEKCCKCKKTIREDNFSPSYRLHERENNKCFECILFR